MTSMPRGLTGWFASVLGQLEQEGKDTSYVAPTKVPAYVMNGEYDRSRPTLEFLRQLARDNVLRRGLFLPLDCVACGQAVCVFVPASGDPMLLSLPDADALHRASLPGSLPLRAHHCLKHPASKVSAIRHCLPAVLTWRQVEAALRANPAWSVRATSGTVIGFALGREEGDLLIRASSRVASVVRVAVAKTVHHPVYTLVVAVPDPYSPGLFVARAPTLEQVSRGLAGSLGPVIPIQDLKSSVRQDEKPSPDASALPFTLRPVIGTSSFSKGAKKKARHVKGSLPAPERPPATRSGVSEKYPTQFSRQEVLIFFRAVTVDTLPVQVRERWVRWEMQLDWHLGGVVPQHLAHKFVKVLDAAEKDPEQRSMYLPLLSRIGQDIVLAVQKVLAKQQWQ